MCDTGLPHSLACDYYADGGDVHHSAAHHGLLAILKGDHDHVEGAKKGRRALEGHAKGFFDKPSPTAQPEDTDALHAHLTHLEANPSAMLDVGANSPHAAQLGALTGAAVSYFSAIKPRPVQGTPLDKPLPPNKVAEAQYHRQLANAQNPAGVIERAKNGTLLPADKQTLVMLYPKLAQAMKGRLFEELVKAKTEGKHISYRQKLGLSTLLGQPMDNTLTPQSMQAIMSAQGPQQAQNQAKTPQKASGPELSTIAKVDSLSETPLEARLAHRKR